MSKPVDTPTELPESIPRKADDEEKQSQSSAITRIQSMRDHLADYQVWFAQNEITQDVTHKKQIASYHKMAQGLLQILRQYFVSDMGGAGEYWTETQIAAFDIEPPAALQQPSKGQTRAAIRTKNANLLQRAAGEIDARRQRFVVQGLREYAMLDPEFSVTWDVRFGPNVSSSNLRREVSDENVTVHDRTRRHEPIKVEKRVAIPKFVIDNAVTTMENFLTEVGLDIEFRGEDYMAKGEPGI